MPTTSRLPLARCPLPSTWSRPSRATTSVS
jgi:hypothetical protein